MPYCRMEGYPFTWNLQIFTCVNDVEEKCSHLIWLTSVHVEFTCTCSIELFCLWQMVPHRLESILQPIAITSSKHLCNFKLWKRYWEQSQDEETEWYQVAWSATLVTVKIFKTKEHYGKTSLWQFMGQNSNYEVQMAINFIEFLWHVKNEYSVLNGPANNQPVMYSKNSKKCHCVLYPFTNSRGSKWMQKKNAFQ